MNAEMKTSQIGLEFIARWEGLVLNPYMDVASLWTIGVGHLIKPTDSFSTITNSQIKDLLASKDKNHPIAKLTISREEALDILAKDVKNVEDDLKKFIKTILNQNQFDALVSFGFNCGTGVFKTSGACKAVAAGNFNEVPVKLLDWSKVRINGELKVNKGLLARRTAEGQLFSRTPVDLTKYEAVPWTHDALRDIQTKLKKLGMYEGLADGLMGPKTQAGIERFSKSKNIPIPHGIVESWLKELNTTVA
jgi:lysozyme